MFKIIEDNKTYIIGEIGINHNGDVNLAKKLIDVAIDAGADAVKFQKRDINSCYTVEELNAPRKSPWGSTNRDQKNGLEFNADQYMQLFSHAKRNKIACTASPWDLKSIEFLMNYDIPFIKIPSALITNKAFLKACAETKKPLFLSTGMCDRYKIIDIVKYLEKQSANISCIYHCTSTYPSELNELNLLGIETLKRTFPYYNIGYSGHERGLSTTLAAVVLGSKSIERHITMDRASYGSDQASSLEPTGFKRLVRDIRDFEIARGDGTIKVYDSELPIIKKLRKCDDFVRLTAG